MIKVMLVEDHAIVREGLKRLVSDDSDMVVVAEAENGGEAIDKVRSERSIDIVVLDLTLPDRNGFDVLRQIRTLRPDVPVLILSMRAEQEYAVRAFRAGAAGYLTKKSAPEQLLSALHKVASGGRFVTPELAEHLAFELQRKEVGEPHKLLSEREFQVFLMIVAGKPVRDIAHDLNLSVKTVNNYRLSVLRKMAMKSNAELVRYAVVHDLLE